MEEKSDKFLLALDCYDQSLNVVRYFSKIIPPHRYKVVLYHVDIEVPEVLLDMEKNWGTNSDEIPLTSWLEKEKSLKQNLFKEAKDILLNNGFSRESISIKVQPRNKGVARDILEESRNGYKAMLIGRSETGDYNETSIGSVASKLIDQANHLPLAVVGGNPDTSKILIGFDQSKGASKSVDFAGSVFQDSDCMVTLCHIIRSLKLDKIRKKQSQYDYKIFLPEHELKWQKINQEQIRPALDEAEQRLFSLGWQTNRVSNKIVLDVNRRSYCLMQESRNGGYGTIILGRQGTSIVKEFFLGSVAKKVLQMADKRAVWIIS